MRLLDSVRRSARSLRHAKGRTILTVLAISVGSFALMIAIAAGQGARDFVNRLVTSNFDSQALYVVKDAKILSGGDSNGGPFGGSGTPQQYDASVNSGSGYKELNSDDIAKLRGIKGVEFVQPTMSVKPQYIRANISGAKPYVTDVEAYNSHQKPELLAGTAPTTLGSTQIILPETYADILGFGSTAADAVGKTLTFHYVNGANQISDRNFTIVGVAKKPNGLIGGATKVLMGSDQMRAIYDFLYQGTPQYNQFLTATLRVRDGYSVSSVQRAVQDKGFSAESAKDLAEQVTQAVNLVQYFVAGFGIIALIVSIFGIVNTQLISVLERTREIGLMKALGMSGAGVLQLFTMEATWIGFGGAVLGIFIAYLAAIFANPFLNDKLSLGGDLLVFQLKPVLGLIVALMVIAAVAGLLPAWKAARLNPIEALRTE